MDAVYGSCWASICISGENNLKGNKLRYFIYGRETCPFCVAACNYFDATERKYTFFDHKDDLEFLSYVKEFYESPTVPIILENNLDTGEVKKIGGYTDLLDRFEHDNV